MKKVCSNHYQQLAVPTPSGSRGEMEERATRGRTMDANHEWVLELDPTGILFF